MKWRVWTRPRGDIPWELEAEFALERDAKTWAAGAEFRHLGEESKITESTEAPPVDTKEKKNPMLDLIRAMKEFVKAWEESGG